LPELQGLILAGGEGSRLAVGGAGGGIPKPMVRVAGRPQVVRLIETFEDLGCSTITCMVRDEFPDVVAELGGGRHSWRGSVRVHGCRTPSSLHTLAEGLARVPEAGDGVFVTMVDTVMRRDDWRGVFAAAGEHLAAGSDAVLAVTPFVDDEAALYVSSDAGAGGRARVHRISSTPLEPVSVTGGVYAFAPRVRPLAADALKDGVVRMRNFLARLVDRSFVVTAVSVPRIMDLDRPSDLEAANAWLGEHE